MPCILKKHCVPSLNKQMGRNACENDGYNKHSYYLIAPVNV